MECFKNQNPLISYFIRFWLDTEVTFSNEIFDIVIT